MSIDNELIKEGYELAEGRNEDDRATQIWINEKTGKAIRIEWFPLGKVKG